MGDKQKIKIQNTIDKLEERLVDLPKMTQSDRRTELKKLNDMLNTLDNDIQRFQMTELFRFPEECEKFEQLFNELTEKLNGLNSATDAAADEPQVQEDPEAVQRQIHETNTKLREGKSRAVAMLYTINNMKEEISLIDDEVLLQREKLSLANEKIKQSQSILNHTKNIISYFTNTFYDDTVIRILIALIFIMVLVLLGLAITIKVKRSDLEKDQAKISDAEINYDDLDELMFEEFSRLNNYSTKQGQPSAADSAQPKPTDDPDDLAFKSENTLR